MDVVLLPYKPLGAVAYSWLIHPMTCRLTFNRLPTLISGLKTKVSTLVEWLKQMTPVREGPGLFPQRVIKTVFHFIFQLENSPYGIVAATHLTAVAAKDNVSAIVEVTVFLLHILRPTR